MNIANLATQSISLHSELSKKIIEFLLTDLSNTSPRVTNILNLSVSPDFGLRADL